MVSRTLLNEIEALSYEDKKELYHSIFWYGTLGTNKLNDKLILVSLIALTYSKLKEKDSTVTPLKVLLKITNQAEDNSGFYFFLQSLALLVEDFSYGITQFDTCGLTTSQEIINKIKELLSTWLPF